MVVYLLSSNETAKPAYAKEEATEKVQTAISLETKTMGNPEAPVTLYEYSSLTCGHCANFHVNTLKELKSEYIDTGKLYYVYNDFPLNKPALDASLLSHCMPEERFWSFLDFLFAQQKEWAFDSKDYLKSLKQNSKLAGLSDEQTEACLNDKVKSEAIIERMQKAAEKYEIDATPTFVLKAGGREEKLVGNLPASAFKETMEKLLKQEGTSQP